MRRWAIILAVLAIIGASFGTVYASSPPGPAPNSGDGIPDGPTSDGDPWPIPPGPSGPNGK